MGSACRGRLASLIGLAILRNPQEQCTAKCRACTDRLRALVPVDKAPARVARPSGRYRSSVHGYETEEGAPRRLGTGRSDTRTIPYDHQESLMKDGSLSPGLWSCGRLPWCGKKSGVAYLAALLLLQRPVPACVAGVA